MPNSADENRVLVTGGAGFIGSALVRYLVEEVETTVLNVDALTYAGNLSSLKSVESIPNYRFVKADIRSSQAMADVFQEFQPTLVMHLAAESHVDRSIDKPFDFVQTNVLGTCQLLQCSLDYWKTLSPDRADSFRFLHVSTN